MVRRERFVWVGLCVGVLAATACADAALAPDGATSIIDEARDAGEPEAGTSSQTFFEAGAARAAEDAPGPERPLDVIDILIDQSTSALTASVSVVEHEAIEDQVTVGGIRFRLFSDRVRLTVTRRVGEIQLGEGTVSVGPTRCDGYDADGGRIAATISTCRSPDVVRPFVAGATVLVFTRGSAGPWVVLGLPVDRAGLVDFGDTAAPSGDHDLDSVWRLIESRWPR